METLTMEEHTLSGVIVRPLAGTRGLVHVAEPRDATPELSRWLSAHAVELEAMGATRALLFRGFDVQDRSAFERLVGEVSRPLSYVYRSTPRTEVGQRVYTTTEYPAARTIPLHCENAYQDVWPTHLMLYCDRPADVGGETPLGDVAAITQAIPASIKEEFRRKQIKYSRNYRAGLDLSWQTVFQTEDRSAVEAYCQAHQIDWTWIGADDLRTEQIRPAMIEHPRTKETLWFNQAHLFHVCSLDEATRSALLSLYAPDELPRHVTYGDGSPIQEDAIVEICRTFERFACAFAWERHDTLFIDNLSVAHGRNPYSGPRAVLVSMGNLGEQAKSSR